METARILYIPDVLDAVEDSTGRKAIQIKGMTFDVEFAATFRKVPGKHAKLINTHMGQLHIVVEGNYIPVDHTVLKLTRNSIYSEIIMMLVGMAMHMADSTPDYKWRVDEKDAA